MSQPQSFAEVGVSRLDEPLALAETEEGSATGRFGSGVIKARRNGTLQEDLFRQNKNGSVAYLA
jgi:hypothetical protein